MKRTAWALALVAVAGLVGCDDSGDEDAGAGTVVSVPVAGVTQREVLDTAEFIGRVEPVDSVDLTARVEGFLERQGTKEGSYVEDGAELFLIEPAPYEAAVEQAQAEVSQTHADLALAQVELNRAEELLSRATIPQAQYDTALAQRDAAQARVQAAEAGRRQAELRLGYTKVTAPFSGRIGRIAASEGAVVGPGTGPLANLTRVSPIYVAFSLGEGEFFSIIEASGTEDLRENVDPANSPRVTVELPNGATYPEDGAIVFIDNRVDPRTGTIGLRAQFDNARGLLWPGAFVNVRVGQQEPDLRLVVPQAAVQRDQRGPFVLTVGDDGLVEQRYVDLGKQVGTDFVVLGGVQEGESVIVEGLQRVRPGVPVEAVTAGAQEG
jgi:RND family efflux transporter MFP subunit